MHWHRRPRYHGRPRADNAQVTSVPPPLAAPAGRRACWPLTANWPSAGASWPRAPSWPGYRSRFLTLADDLPVWSIPCFFVRRAYRRRGVTAALIQAAVGVAAAAGAPRCRPAQWTPPCLVITGTCFLGSRRPSPSTASRSSPGASPTVRGCDASSADPYDRRPPSRRRCSGQRMPRQRVTSRDRLSNPPRRITDFGLYAAGAGAIRLAEPVGNLDLGSAPGARAPGRYGRPPGSAAG